MFVACLEAGEVVNNGVDGLEVRLTGALSQNN
jgi:hypothetical protein